MTSISQSDPGWQSDVDGMLTAVRESTDPAFFRRLWTNLLAKAEADAVLVACLDLSGIVRFAETELPIVDAADCLARAIVKRWMSA